MALNTMQRRTLLKTASASAMLSLTGLASKADANPADANRLLVVLLRGGMDGLTAVPPVADPMLEGLRPNLRIQQALRLDGSFGLHPALGQMHALWQQGQLAIVHSAGFAYTGRSHFEGQDVMQSGVMKPYASATGWVGRAMELARVDSGVAIAIPMPLILRGHDNASTEYPNWMRSPQPSLMTEVNALWRADKALAPYGARLLEDSMATSAPRGLRGDEFAQARSPASLARLAGQRMSAPDGPRIGLIDMEGGFDTHASQGADSGAHANKLSDLDGVIGAYRQAMGAMWARTLVLTVTEFGRTVAENGTTGTDHGVGSCCFLAGGLVAKAQVLADWRGLAKAQLFEGRDLPATIDTSAVHAQVLQKVFGLSLPQVQSVLAFKPHAALSGLLG